MGKNKSVLCMLVLATIVACTENLADDQNGQDGQIRFTVSMADEGLTVTRGMDVVKIDSVTDGNGQSLYVHTTVEPRQQTVITRGTQVNSMDDFSNLNDFKFGVSGTRYSTTNPLASQNANFFFNAEATYSLGAWWTNKEYYLPTASEQLAFYAYWPYSDNCTDITGVKGDNATDVGPMKISFQVNTTDMASQTDLMTATVIGQSYTPKAPVTLPFKHALTAVNFQLGSDITPGYIKRIELQSVCTAGEYTLSSNGTAAGTWAPTDLKTITFDFTNGGSTVGLNTETASTLLNSSTGSLLMIPQTFTNDTQRLMICINDSEDGTDTHGDHYLSKPLSEIVNWQEGTVVTYLISTSSLNYLRVNSVSYPTTWGTETFSLKSDYNANETMGVYVVDETGKVIIANMPYTKSSVGNWSASDPTSIPYNSSYKYFAYYPYSSAVTGGPQVNDTFLGTDADSFFSGLINDWTLNDDQSSSSYLLSRDLQICRATAASTVTKMDFPMKHAFGLAVLTLEQTTIPTDLYYLTTDANYTWTDGETTITASSDFSSTAKPCLTSTPRTYYYMVKPGSTATFNANATTADDEWSAGVTTNTMTGNSSEAVTAQLKGTSTHLTNGYINGYAHTLKIGDVYFTDGALGAKATTYGSRKTAIGTVISTTTTDKDKALYPHGYVMASRGSFAGEVRFCTNNTTATGNTYIAKNLNSIISDMDGLTKTEKIKTITNYQTLFPAVNAAVNTFTSHYAPPAKPRSSGWFLPSSGQCFAWLSIIADEYFGAGNWSYQYEASANDYYGVYFMVNGDRLVSPAFITATNTFYTTNRGFVSNDENYANMTWNSTYHNNIWTSSEFSLTEPINLRYGSGKGMWIICQEPRTEQQVYARAALAF